MDRADRRPAPPACTSSERGAGMRCGWSVAEQVALLLVDAAALHDRAGDHLLAHSFRQRAGEVLRCARPPGLDDGPGDPEPRGGATPSR